MVSAVEYAKEQFLMQVPADSRRRVYVHVMCALNREDISLACDDFTHVVVNAKLHRGMNIYMCLSKKYVLIPYLYLYVFIGVLT